jgi:hypothetical protein
MPCTAPIDAWPASPDAKDRRVVFSPFRSYQGARALSIPCGKCVSCIQSRCRATAVRAHHEMMFHDVSSFVTVTYEDSYLPKSGTLEPDEFQRFLKRVRNNHGPFRFLACGEYGDQFKRPHYHALLFGLDFPDAVPWSVSSGEVLKRSPSLETTWGRGQVLIGTASFRSAAYIAGYVGKKAGVRDDRRLLRGAVDPDTGEIFCDPETGEQLPHWKVAPEFIRQSSRPGLGREWIDTYRTDAFPSGFVVINGEKHAVPRYYRKVLTDTEKLLATANAKAASRRHTRDQTQKRLMGRHDAKRYVANQRSRSLDKQS